MSGEDVLGVIAIFIVIIGIAFVVSGLWDLTHLPILDLTKPESFMNAMTTQGIAFVKIIVGIIFMLIILAPNALRFRVNTRM